MLYAKYNCRLAKSQVDILKSILSLIKGCDCQMSLHQEDHTPCHYSLSLDRYPELVSISSAYTYTSCYKLSLKV